MRRRTRALAVALVGIVGSCASAEPIPPDLGPDGVIVTRQELAALKAAAGRVETLGSQLDSLRADNAALRDRVAELEVRAGLRPFEPKHLAPMTGRMVLPDALRVERAGDRGRRASLARELADSRGLVVAYWATWCVPCTSAEELRAVRELRRQLAPHGVRLVSVAIDSLDDVQRHPRAGEWVYPLWQRNQAHFAMLPQRFVREHGVNLPLFVVVAPSGEARWFHEGALTEAALRELVDAALLARGL